MLKKIFFYNYIVFGFVCFIMAINIAYLAYPHLTDIHYKGIAAIIVMAVSCFVIATTKNRLSNLRYILLNLLATLAVAFMVYFASPKISGFAFTFTPAFTVLLIMLINKVYQNKKSKGT